MSKTTPLIAQDVRTGLLCGAPLVAVMRRSAAASASSVLFLDLRNHWEAVLEFILVSAREQGCQIPEALRPASFRVISVEENHEVIGDEVGSGLCRLYLLNEGFMHFVPLIRRRR